MDLREKWTYVEMSYIQRIEVNNTDCELYFEVMVIIGNPYDIITLKVYQPHGSYKEVPSHDFCVVTSDFKIA